MTLVLEIEEAAFRAWPAEEVVELSGWRLRFTHGVTRRANSVWPNGWYGQTPLPERVRDVEAFAASRGISPSFQLTSAARPKNLDAWLEARGYVIDAPVVVETRDLKGAKAAQRPPFEAVVSASPNADWLSVAVERGRFRTVPEHYAGILSRIGSRGGFALVRSNDVPIAIGLGVVDGPWLGIFNMATVPEARSRGAARAILEALARWGAEGGARRAYLQVEHDNAAARSLYRAAGFVAAYDYHYRTKFDGKQPDGC